MNTWNETFEPSMLAPNSDALERLSSLRLVMTLNGALQMHRRDPSIPTPLLEPGALVA
jgi:hypothetical protein